MQWDVDSGAYFYKVTDERYLLIQTEIIQNLLGRSVSEFSYLYTFSFYNKHL